eukprot:14340697-Heterocapsa_arctica.AAC.1
MKSNSICIGHTKLKEYYTVKCSSASGIVCFGTASYWLARQPRVSPSPANREALHYITIWYLPAGASSRATNQAKTVEERAKPRQEAAGKKKTNLTRQEPTIPTAKFPATHLAGSINKEQAQKEALKSPPTTIPNVHAPPTLAP